MPTPTNNLHDLRKNTQERFEKLGIANRPLQNLNIPGADLSGCDLRGLNFAGSNFSSANFSYSLLDDSDFTRCDLNKANFSGCTALNTSFDRAKAQGASFRKALLAKASFIGTQLDSIIDVQKRSILALTDFQEAIASEAVFRSATMVRASCRYADFSKAVFDDTIISSDMQENIIVPTDFTGTILCRAVMRNLVLSRAAFSHAKMEMVELTGSDLSYIPLTNVSLWRAKIIRCNLSNLLTIDDVIFDETDLSSSNISFANLYNARALATSSLKGVTYNQKTVFPLGFSPNQHGLTLKQ